MNTVHYLNGEFVTEENLLVSPRDLGFARSYAVFDFFRTYNGHKPFMFDYHIERFFNSAKAIGLVLPWTREDVKNIILKTLEKNDKDTEFAVRITATGGMSPSLIQSDKPTLMVVLDQAIEFPKSMYENGIKARTVNHKRYNPASKTTHYTEAVQHAQGVEANGPGEVLYVFDNLVLEGAFWSFFCVVNGTLVTPKNDILPGITRRVVLEKLSLDIPIEVRDLPLQELDDATEAFVTATGKGIVPLVKIDDKTIGNGKVGPITKDVMGKYRTFVASGSW